jgi:hypothetical protein
MLRIFNFQVVSENKLFLYCREEWRGPEVYRCLSMDYLLLGVYAGALVLGILGPVLVLCLYRNLRGCARYIQVP